MKNQLVAFDPEINVICVDTNADTFACNSKTYDTFLSYPGFTDFTKDRGITVEIVESLRDNYVYMVDSARIEEELNV